MNSFVIADPERCIGCRTCEVACATAHAGEDMLLRSEEQVPFYPRLRVMETNEITAPVQCRHCEDAPCANVCPNGSIVNRGHSIYINESTCIGCKTCMLVCPYGAITMTPAYQSGRKEYQAGLRMSNGGGWIPKERMVASKCDLCEGSGQGPECVRICPTQALQLVQPNELEQEIASKRLNTARTLRQFGGLIR